MLLIVLTLCFIWGNSFMPASVSDAISGWFKDLINGILGSTGSRLNGDGVLRKVAHASEFAVLGIVVTPFVTNKLKNRLTTLALCGLGTALLDETIQLVVIGRNSQIKDVWIDFGGFTVGVMLSLFVNGLVRRHNRKTKYQSRC